MRNVSIQEQTSSVSDGDRLTRFGSFLRRYSIDELPQLINVMRGDMSIVGPRPLPMPYNTRYTPEQRRRLLARPGLTGLSQATTRNSSEWPQKLALDVEYITRASFLLDLKIILGTFRVVLTGSGVAAPGHATMPEFKATPSGSDQ
jgi:lipopolysaccharide/colanic/teichoic acid biosynthesis glycosyltransferase